MVNEPANDVRIRKAGRGVRLFQTAYARHYPAPRAFGGITRIKSGASRRVRCRALRGRGPPHKPARTHAIAARQRPVPVPVPVLATIAGTLRMPGGDPTPRPPRHADSPAVPIPAGTGKTTENSVPGAAATTSIPAPIVAASAPTTASPMPVPGVDIETASPR